jgi:hypothetical protein
MATFRCSSCGCDDDSALCNYWSDRVRDIPPVCSACDPKIGRWHGQFPRLFGPFLMTPNPVARPREVLAGLVRRLTLAECAYNDTTTESDRQAQTSVPSPGDGFCFDDPIPAYKPLASHLR